MQKAIMNTTPKSLILPDDQHNRKLIANVHPLDWTNPTPKKIYDLVVIGAGTAGLVTAAGAAGLGAKVALVEKNLMGGDCLNVGCVPSKALLAASHAAAAVRNAAEFGVNVSQENMQLDFSFIMERMREMRANISRHDSAKRFQDLGVDVFIGAGAFTSDGTEVQVGDQRLKFKKAVLCTGARAAAPPIPGLETVDYLTNETLFSLTELPKRFAIVGGGPIGCEMAQAFARFGSEVHLYERGARIMPRDDEDASQVLLDALQKDGCQVFLNSGIEKIESEGREKAITAKIDGEIKQHKYDALLIAVGRAPNVEGLNLEAANVKFDKTGVQVNDNLRTTNRKIYAAGDICFPFKFTHSADFLARIVIQNTLFFGRGKASKLIIPWATYTSPEVAHVGLLPIDAQKEGIEIQTFTQQMKDVDRAYLEGEENGFVKVHVKKGTDRIVGATIVAKNAGDLISEITVAMKNKVGLKAIGATIHPYPTQAEAIRKLGDQYNRTRLTPFTKWLLKFLIKLH